MLKWEFQLTRSRGAWPSADFVIYCIWIISTHTLTWSVTCCYHFQLRVVKFQLTRSRGAWRRWQWSRDSGERFQLTRSRGAWQIASSAPKSTFTFQLTRSRGAWQLTNAHKNKIVQFQLTRSRGAWRSQYHMASYLYHFNSHAHVERDYRSYHVTADDWISTHTLTWSVTHRTFCMPAIRKISTHTLTWSVTGVFAIFVKFFTFQLTRSRGAWHSDKNGKPWFKKISTHTLTWSVTNCYIKFPVLLIFQLTRSRGAWLYQFLVIAE